MICIALRGTYIIIKNRLKIAKDSDKAWHEIGAGKTNELLYKQKLNNKKKRVEKKNRMK